MHETPGRSVGPTASESMLNPRRANIVVIRVSAPGLSSTRTDSVCFTTPSPPPRPTARTRPCRAPPRPSGIIGKHCSAGSTRQSTTTVRLARQRLRERGLELLLVLDDHADPAVGLGEERVVGHLGGQVDVRAAPVEEHVLPLRDHPEVAVVDEHDDDREVVDDGGRELLRGHLEAAVAVDADDRRLRARRLGADRGRDPVAHRPEPARGDEAPRPLREQVLHRPHLVLADAGRDDHVVAGGERLQRLDDALRLQPARRSSPYRSGNSSRHAAIWSSQASGAGTPSARWRRDLGAPAPRAPP